MKEHDVQTVEMRERATFKDVDVEYDAKLFYCDRTDEFFIDEDMLSANNLAMKQAYVSQLTESKA